MKRSDSGHKDGNRSHLHGKYLIIDFLMMMIMMCVCVWGANIAFGLFHTSYSNLFSLWLKWLQDVVLCGFNIHWAIQWPLLVPRGLKKRSLQKRPLPSRWTWSLIMVFSGICFIPWRFDGHKIPPPAFKDCQRMGCVPCKGIYDFF